MLGNKMLCKLTRKLVNIIAGNVHNFEPFSCGKGLLDPFYL